MKQRFKDRAKQEVIISYGIRPLGEKFIPTPRDSVLIHGFAEALQKVEEESIDKCAEVAQNYYLDNPTSTPKKKIASYSITKAIRELLND